MRKNMRNLVKGLVGAVVLLFLAVAGYAATYVYVGTPASGKVATFHGFVTLPKGAGVLNVLDYMHVDGQSMFVANESSGFVYKIGLQGSNLPSAEDVSVFSLPSPTPAAHGVAIDPVSHLAYMTRAEANTVDIFDPSTFQLVKRIPVADDCDAIFYDPTTKLIYVASGDAHMATLIDPATQAIVATIPLGAKPEYAALDPEDKLLYQNLGDTNSLASIDLVKKAVVERWVLDQCEKPTAMSIDVANRRLFIACGKNSQLKVFDLTQHKIVASLDIGGNPDSVVYDKATGRIFTTGKPGDVTIIEQDSPDQYRVVDTIHTHYGAHTLAYDPSARALFVGYASLLVAPRLAMFTIAPR